MRSKRQLGEVGYLLGSALGKLRMSIETGAGPRFHLLPNQEGRQS